MKRFVALLIISALLDPSAAGAGNAPTPALCKRVDASRTGWTHPAIGVHANEIWIARADCKSINTAAHSYRPVSGGFRYEGIWNDTSMAQEWQVVANEPYQSLDKGPVDGWQCMVRSIPTDPAPKMPESIWCAVTCCPE